MLGHVLISGYPDRVFASANWLHGATGKHALGYVSAGGGGTMWLFAVSLDDARPGSAEAELVAAMRSLEEPFEQVDTIGTPEGDILIGWYRLPEDQEALQIDDSHFRRRLS